MNWDWLYTLYSISSAFLVITFSWKIIEKAFVLIAVVFNDFVSGLFVMLCSAVPYYFNAAFSALAVNYIGDGKPPLYLIVIVALFLVFNSMIGTVNLQREAEKNGQYQNLRLIKFRYVYLVFEIVIFIVSLMNMKIAINSITIWLAEFMSWIQSVPILNIIVAIMAFINAIYIILMALGSLFYLIISVFETNKNLDA